MFYLLVRCAENDGSIEVVDCIGKAERLAEAIQNVMTLRPGLPVIVTEQLWQVGDALPIANKVPPELDRAVVAWNRMCRNAVVHIAQVKKVARYIATFRRWKRETAGRDYLLEQLVDDVARQTWTHQWIEFGWLFGKKNGTNNSDKLRSGKFENGIKGNPNRPRTADDEFTPTER